VHPDLVLITTGVQRQLGRRLAEQGLPVYAVPLPNSFHGMLENFITLGGLMNEMAAGRELVERLASQAAELRRQVGEEPPRVYVELWFGRHLRTIGGYTFIHDLVTMAGGRPIFADRREGYFKPDFEEVVRRRPELVMLFSEPEYPVDAQALFRERGWHTSLDVPLVESTVDRGRNLIHDGPSIMETAAWLRGEIDKAISKAN
jgi:ABC-type Fe3+-hydroxamate transport system substrate-binding protein